MPKPVIGAVGVESGGPCLGRPVVHEHLQFAAVGAEQSRRSRPSGRGRRKSVLAPGLSARHRTGSRRAKFFAIGIGLEIERLPAVAQHGGGRGDELGVLMIVRCKRRVAWASRP